MRRKSIRLEPHDIHLLKQLHLIYRIPVDQWTRRPRLLATFIAKWNAEAGRSDTADDIRHFIITKRKNGQWVTFKGGDYEKLQDPLDDTLTPDEWNHLRAAYAQINKGRDRYAADGVLRDALAQAFLERTGRHLAGDYLYALAMTKQKRGLWVLVTPEDDTKGMGFSDIDEVV